MKKILILLMSLMLVFGLTATSAFAQESAATTESASTSNSSSGIGLRAGLTSGPDQFHFGAHIDLGQVLAPMRLVPNIEIGLGDNVTNISLNGDLIYDFAGTPFGVGGELALQYVDHEAAGSDTELGMSALGNYRLGLDNGKTLLFEIKFGLMDAPDFKFTVGYSFF